jgi:pSer/pThr/pTyr-binding forkhead associated (FHA) protein
MGVLLLERGLLIGTQMICASESTAVIPKTFTLRYSTDRGPVSKFSLPSNRVVVVGRALDADLRFNDGLTSRRHATFSVEDSQVVIEDLESANGTFVNGRKARRAVLKLGDRILIGITTLELGADEIKSSAPAVRPSPAPSRNPDSETTIVGTARVMSGSVKEIPLADLLQLLTATRKSGLLTIRNQRDTGQLFLRDGRICHATINDSAAVQPERTFYRLLRWQSGFFELRPLGKVQFTEDLRESTESLLLEAASQHDELLELERQLPRLDARLLVPENLPGELDALSGIHMDVLQLVLEHGILLKVIDHFPGSDLDAYRAVVEMVKLGFVIAE